MDSINLFSVVLSLILWSEVILTDVLPTCRSEDFKYSFTECDDSGGRWRVSVPKSPNQCVGGAPNAAIRVDKCFTSCESGHYFNSSSLQCEECSPGYYSLGGGIRIESFKNSSLPSGFRLSAQSINNSGSCVGWRLFSNYVQSVANNSGDGCISKISYTVRIVKKGKLSFKYQYSVPDDLSNAIIFTFQYQNYDDSDSQDLSGGDSEVNTRVLSVTEGQKKWKEFKLNLQKPGLYVFVWRSVLIGRSKGFFQNTGGTRSVNWFIGQSGSHSSVSLIRLKSISIDGVAYASECTPCRPGTYSEVSGAANCTPCPINTESPTTGATKCSECDSQTKYAPKGSERCLEKPICGKNDYYSIEGNCYLKTQQQRISYKWIEPTICSDKYNIKPQNEYRSCNKTTAAQRVMESCNLGLELREDQKCHFCDENQYRDGTTDKCQSCPPLTSPHYALSYKIWRSTRADDDSLPEFMSTECILTDEGSDYSCDANKAWFPYSKEYIRSGTATPLGSYLFLTLSVPGFRHKSGGELTFKFEIECDSGDNCLLIFMETIHNAKLSQQTNIIREWNEKSVGRLSFRYTIQTNTSLALSWIFQRNLSFQSNAKIYEITLTNPIVGSAIKCNPCPHSNTAYCITCPFGKYIDTNDLNSTQKLHEIKNRNLSLKTDKHCKRCPKNSIINSSLAFPIGQRNSCIPCGPGLIDYNGISCFSNCDLNIDGDMFYLSQLNQPLIYRGGHLFTGSGTHYYHLFNITLCGEPNFKAVCVDNITTFDTNTDLLTEEYGIHSMICRSTIVPDSDQSMAAQSVSLGDELIGITRNTTFQNITVHSEFQTTKSDLHLYYSTPVPTAACPNGRKLTLTVRCVPELEQNNLISTPKECPDGTCDGCTFHLLVKTNTSAACRLCRQSDYETVVSECVEGFQSIHFVNPKGCIISADGQKRIQTRHCSVIPRQVQIGIALVSAIGVVLLVLVFHFWKKNRSLEYKYCKLIEGNEKSAECCAEDEDEEDNDNDDQVMIHPKKPKEVYEEGYETIQLTKHNDRNTNII